MIIATATILWTANSSPAAAQEQPRDDAHPGLLYGHARQSELHGEIWGSELNASTGMVKYTVRWQPWIDNLRSFLYAPLHQLDNQYPRDCVVEVRFRLKEDGTLMSSDAYFLERPKNMTPKTARLPVVIDGIIRNTVTEHFDCLRFPESSLRKQYSDLLRHDVEWTLTYSRRKDKICTLNFSAVNLDETIIVPATGAAPLNAIHLTGNVPHTACMPGEPLSAHQKMSPPAPTVPRHQFGAMRYLRKFTYDKPIGANRLVADQDGF
jgi:hypothetical protein